MFISLVLGTVNRVCEPRQFLASLDAQSYQDFELIIVDQNPDDRLRSVIEEFEDQFTILHLRSSPGLSKARNLGLQHAKGEIVGFPDDDCWYPPDLLKEVVAHWQSGWDGMLGSLIWNNNTKQNQALSPFPINKYGITTSINSSNLFEALVPKENSIPVSSATLFLTKESIQAVNGFDENLGMGSKTGWGAGEDVDLVIRCLKSGFKLFYVSAIKVYHPDPRRGYKQAKRGYIYGAGMGRVLCKHRYPKWFILYHFLRSLGAAGLALVQIDFKKFRYYWAVFRGKWIGWRGKKLIHISNK